MLPLSIFFISYVELYTLLTLLDTIFMQHSLRWYHCIQAFPLDINIWLKLISLLCFHVIYVSLIFQVAFICVVISFMASILLYWYYQPSFNIFPWLQFEREGIITHHWAILLTTKLATPLCVFLIFRIYRLSFYLLTDLGLL